MWLEQLERPDMLDREVWVRDVQPEFVMVDGLVEEIVTHHQRLCLGVPLCYVCRFSEIGPGAPASRPWVGLILKLTNPDGQSWVWRSVEPTPEDSRLDLVRFRWPD